jgi:uncharacterized RDD family membrane protein YckC
VEYYAESPPTMAYAPFPRRLLATFIDYMAVSIAVSPFTARPVSDALARSSPQLGDLMGPALVFLLANVAYSTGMHAWRGSTFGKIAARLVLVNDDGSPVTLAVAFVRAVAVTAIFFASFFVLAPIIVDEIRPLWSPKRQTWHDQIAKTVVVLR